MTTKERALLVVATVFFTLGGFALVIWLAELAPRHALAAPRDRAVTRNQGDPLRSLSTQAEMIRLAAEVATLREELHIRAPVPQPDPESEPVRQLRDDETRAREEAERLSHLAERQADFDAEPTDPKWASQTSGALIDAIKESDSLKQARVECRSRTCRIELADDETAGALDDLQLLIHHSAETLPDARIDRVTEGNDHRVVAFMTSRSAVD